MASVLSRRPRTGKKDLGSKMDSRSSSPTSVSSSKPGHKSKDKGPSKAELEKANSELCREVEELNKENQTLKGTLTAVIDKLIENAKIKGVAVPAEVETPLVTDIPVECLTTFTDKLTAESHKSNTMEYRVEELETRITHLNMELAKLLRSRLDLENGLDEIVCDCGSVDEVKVKAKGLLRDIKSNGLFTFLDSVPIEKTVPEKKSAIQTQQNELKQNGCHGNKNTTKVPPTVTVLLNDQNLDLTPPTVKFPGETNIKYMHKDLRQYIVQQLSFTKGNGADWRLMGERLGIAPETIEQWRRWKLEAPMQQVLQTWSQSPGATVRMLHRHLVSPQMRCTLLAKRISDFYQVD